MRFFRLPALVLAATLLSSCGGGGSSDDPVFVFRMRGLPESESFRVQTSDARFIADARAQLALPARERRMFPLGRLVAGNGGHNAPWSWHLQQPELAEVSIELCDGRPSMVEADLRYWINRVRSFCPWGGYVAEEL